MNGDNDEDSAGSELLIKTATAEEELSDELATRGALSQLNARDIRAIVGGWAATVNKVGLRERSAAVCDAFFANGIDTIGDLRLVDEQDCITAGMTRAEGKRFAMFMRTTDRAEPNFTEATGAADGESLSSGLSFHRRVARRAAQSQGGDGQSTMGSVLGSIRWGRQGCGRHGQHHGRGDGTPAKGAFLGTG